MTKPPPVPALALLALCTCGAADRPVPQAPPAPSQPPSPGASETTGAPARWYFEPEKEPSQFEHFPFAAIAWVHGTAIVGTVDLGDGAKLGVLQNGLRFVDSRTGDETAAQGLVLPHVAAVGRLADGTLAAVDAEGAFARFRDPLGPAIIGHTTQRFTRVVAGRNSFLALTPAGAVVRSTDGGATWTDGGLPASPGVNAGILMLPTGFGQVLRIPQQLFETHDDGATWARTTRSLWLGGRAAEAAPTADDNKPADESGTREPGTSLHWLASHDDRESTEYEIGRVFTDGALYTASVAPSRKETDTGWPSPGLSTLLVRVLHFPQAEQSGEQQWTGDLLQLGAKPECVGSPPTSVAMAGRRGVLALVIPCRKGTMVFTSVDAGGSFALAPLPPSTPTSALDEEWNTSLPFVTGDGSILLSQWQDSSKGRLLRIERDRTVHPVADVAPTELDLAPDGTVVGLVQGAERLGVFVHPYFVVSSDAGRTFRRVTIPSVLDSGQGDLVPVQGIPGAIGHDSQGHPFALLDARRRSQPSFDPVPLRATLGDGDRVETTLAPWFDAVSLDGSHGIVTANGEAYETSDGARTFRKIVVPSLPPICGGGACLFETAIRVGWEHEGRGPIPATAFATPNAGVWERAMDIAAKPKPSTSDRPELQCAPEGAWTRFEITDYVRREGEFPPTPGVIWIGEVRGKDHGRDEVFVVRKAGRWTHEVIPLLAPTSDDVDSEDKDPGPYGIVSLRERLGHGGARIPEGQRRIEVGWIDARTLTRHASEIVGGGSLYGLAQVVEDGVVVRQGDHLTILGADHGIRRLAWPPDKRAEDEDLGYGTLLLGRSDRFVALAPSSLGDDTAATTRLVVAKGAVTHLPAWALGDKLAGASRDGATAAWVAGQDEGDPRIVVTDPADPAPEAVTRDVSLTDVLSAHPPVCAPEGPASWRLRRRGSALVPRVDGFDPVTPAQVEVEVDVSDGRPACAARVAFEVHEPARTGRPSDDRVTVDLEHPEAAVLVRTTATQQGQTLEVRAVRCALDR